MQDHPRHVQNWQETMDGRFWSGAIWWVVRSEEKPTSAVSRKQFNTASFFDTFKQMSEFLQLRHFNAVYAYIWCFWTFPETSTTWRMLMLLEKVISLCVLNSFCSATLSVSALAGSSSIHYFDCELVRTSRMSKPVKTSVMCKCVVSKHLFGVQLKATNCNITSWSRTSPITVWWDDATWW